MKLELGGADRRDERGSWYCLKVRGSQGVWATAGGDARKLTRLTERPWEVGVWFSAFWQCHKDTAGWGEKKTGKGRSPSQR